MADLATAAAATPEPKKLTAADVRACIQRHFGSVPEGGTLRKVRDAATNPNVNPVDRHFLGALLRRVAKTDDAFLQTAVDAALKDQRRQHNEEIEKNALSRLGQLREDAEAWVKLRDLLKTKPGDFVYQPDVVDALRILLKAGVSKSYGGLHSLLGEVERMRERLLTIADDLGIEREKKRGRRK